MKKRIIEIVELLTFKSILFYLALACILAYAIIACTDTTAQPSNPSAPIAGCEYTAEMIAEDIYLKHKVGCNNH